MQTMAPAAKRSALAAAPTMIDVDPVDYMHDAFDQCIKHMLSVPPPCKHSFAHGSIAKCFLISRDMNSPPLKSQLLITFSAFALAASPASALPNTPELFKPLLRIEILLFMFIFNERHHQNA